MASKRLTRASASRLVQLFREHTGTTIRAALLRRRLTEAKRLLATTSAPVTEALCESGFNDASYFNRSFRKDTGRTPREFRNHAHQMQSSQARIPPCRFPPGSGTMGAWN